MLLRERKHNRLKQFDYSSAGYYFVTICTKNREEWFGEIINKKMKLTEYGEIVKECWNDLPNHYSICQLDEFIIMPNHIHCIVRVISTVGNRHACSLHGKIYSRRQNQLLPIIIGSFKSTSAKLIHQTRLNSFRWQKSFYDRIIRNEYELSVIREYIKNNPLCWNEDKNNPMNF